VSLVFLMNSRREMGVVGAWQLVLLVKNIEDADARTFNQIYKRKTNARVYYNPEENTHKTKSSSVKHKGYTLTLSVTIPRCQVTLIGAKPTVQRVSAELLSSMINDRILKIACYSDAFKQ